MGDECVPGLAAGLDDRFVGVEDAIGEVVLAKILPDVFDRIELGLDPGRGNMAGAPAG